MVNNKRCFLDLVGELVNLCNQLLRVDNVYSNLFLGKHLQALFGLMLVLIDQLAKIAHFLDEFLIWNLNSVRFKLVEKALASFGRLLEVKHLGF